MLYLKNEIVEDMTLAVHGRIKVSGHISYPVSGRIPDIMTASYAVSKWPKTRNFLLLESTKIMLLITVRKKSLCTVVIDFLILLKKLCLSDFVTVE